MKWCAIRETILVAIADYEESLKAMILGLV
jgi:hypothetical protein